MNNAPALATVIGPVSADMTRAILDTAATLIAQLNEYAEDATAAEDTHLISAFVDAIQGASRVRSVLGTDLRIWETHKA